MMEELGNGNLELRQVEYFSEDDKIIITTYHLQRFVCPNF